MRAEITTIPNLIEYGEDIFSRIVLVRLHPIMHSPWRLEPEHDTMMEITLNDGYVMAIEGTQVELEKEFQKILTARAGAENSLLDLSKVTNSVGMWALDAHRLTEIIHNYIPSFNDGQSAQLPSVWLAMDYNGMNTTEYIELQRKNMMPSLEHHENAGSFAGDIAFMAQQLNGWKSKSMPTGPRANLPQVFNVLQP